MDHNQKDRLNAIRQLLEQKNVEGQASLVQLLKNTYGIESNQTAISRDLHQLGATKKIVAGKTVYDLPQYDASHEILRFAVLSVNHNESLIVVDTLPGLASFVGDYLDLHNDLGILGTLAGENVVFVTPTTIKHIKKVFSKICEILKFKDV